MLQAAFNDWKRFPVDEYNLIKINTFRKISNMQIKSIGLLVTTICLFTACSGLVEPEFQRMENVKVKTATLQGDLILTADAIFNNPNGIGVDLNTMDLDVYVDEVAVAKVVQDISMDMKANADFTLPLKVEIPMVKVFKDAKGGLLGKLLKSRKAMVRMEGDINATFGGITATVPFDYEHEYELKIGIQ